MPARRLKLPARCAHLPAAGWWCKCLEVVVDALLQRLDDLAEACSGGYQRLYDERVRLRQLAWQVQSAKIQRRAKNRVLAVNLRAF